MTDKRRGSRKTSRPPPGGGAQKIPAHFQDVARAFEKLQLNDKLILTLAIIEGMKSDEVAARLDIRRETARKRLSRARARLQALIDAPPSTD
jgi:DNA-directed RNA polymerase specialized sigma24 family protein